jgi:hypothetical protein
MRGPQRELIQQPHTARVQAEVQEIAEVLSRQPGRSIIEVWNEALSLHRVRYETRVLVDAEEDEVTRWNLKR